MNKLTIEEIQEKYRDIEDKIPSVWPDYEKAGVELAQDIVYHWNIQEGELIRVIALVEIKVPGLNITQHIDNRFAFAGLYPFKMKHFTPDDKGVMSEAIEGLLKSRKEYKVLMDENDGSITSLLQKELNRLKEELNKLKRDS